MEERFQTFTVLISNINRAIYRIKTEEMAEFDLKSSHVSCLYYLYKKLSLTSKELCDICEEDKANISRSIKFLEKQGLVTGANPSQKRYQCPFKLTDDGKIIGKKISDKIDTVLSKASDGLDEKKRLEFYSALTLINSNLQKICDEYDNTAN